MAGTTCDDTSFDWASDKSYITKHIKKLMTGRLIFKFQRTIVDISEIRNFLVRHTYEICDMVKFLLRQFPVIYHNRIVQITSFYQVRLQQSLNLTHKNKGTA